MRVFVLGTGRCGTVTFSQACSHITNYTSAHESRTSLVKDRFTYPDQHIEVDGRLSWFLGTLYDQYGDEPLYVHLSRNREKTVESVEKRFFKRNSGIYHFAQGILSQTDLQEPEVRRIISELYVDTVRDNIDLFLKNCTYTLSLPIEDAVPGFTSLWNWIGAEGDFETACAELSRDYNPDQS